jgi:hypothetical protein
VAFPQLGIRWSILDASFYTQATYTIDMAIVRTTLRFQRIPQ